MQISARISLERSKSISGADDDLMKRTGFFYHFSFENQAVKYSPLGALGAKAIEAAIMAKRVTIWKVFMVDM